MDIRINKNNRTVTIYSGKFGEVMVYLKSLNIEDIDEYNLVNDNNSFNYCLCNCGCSNNNTTPYYVTNGTLCG